MTSSDDWKANQFERRSSVVQLSYCCEVNHDEKLIFSCNPSMQFIWQTYSSNDDDHWSCQTVITSAFTIRPIVAVLTNRKKLRVVNRERKNENERERREERKTLLINILHRLSFSFCSFYVRFRSRRRRLCTTSPHSSLVLLDYSLNKLKKQHTSEEEQKNEAKSREARSPVGIT